MTNLIGCHIVLGTKPIDAYKGNACTSKSNPLSWFLTLFGKQRILSKQSPKLIMEWKWQNWIILPCKKVGKILSPFHNLIGASSTGFGSCHRHFDQETNKSQKICKKSCSPRSQIKTCFCFISQFDDAIICSDISRNLSVYLIWIKNKSLKT